MCYGSQTGRLYRLRSTFAFDNQTNIISLITLSSTINTKTYVKHLQNLYYTWNGDNMTRIESLVYTHTYVFIYNLVYVCVCWPFWSS